MNAVAVSADQYVEPVERRLHGNDRAYADAKLKSWGKWIEDHADYQGFAPSDAIVAYINGCGGCTSGPRVLMLDPPEWWWKTNAKVLLMPEHEREAVTAHYVAELKPEGGYWTDEEKAERLGIEFATFRKRVSRGRLRFLGITPPADYM
jgi:hypothetical protein